MTTVINVKTVKICSETIRIRVLYSFLAVLKIDQVFKLNDFNILRVVKKRDCQ